MCCVLSPPKSAVGLMDHQNNFKREKGVHVLSHFFCHSYTIGVSKRASCIVSTSSADVGDAGDTEQHCCQMPGETRSGCSRSLSWSVHFGYGGSKTSALRHMAGYFQWINDNDFGHKVARFNTWFSKETFPLL